ncbi:MAG: UDP-N-acetylmuramoyl-L-alanyl-D-glutamate--2,6-diaminopimelate ligase [Microgenomates group bacterium]
MKLGSILIGVVNNNQIVPNIDIDLITPDSRKVKPGTVFVAYAGVVVDGHSYIEGAIKAGAVAVVGERDVSPSVPYFRVENGRLAWAKMMANFYENPEKKLKIIGVTGTDGKTTTTNLIYAMLRLAGKKVAMVSTIKAVIAEQEFDTGLHTSSPDPDILWKWLEKIVEAGEEYVVLETTSHGLAQYRFGDIKFNVGVLTNLAHDHLEFHKTHEAYRDAKAMLFENSNVSVVNECSAEAEYFKSKATARVVAYDVRKETRNVIYKESKEKIWQEFELKLDGDWKKAKTSLLGEYNLENILAAGKAVKALGVSEEVIIKAIEEFQPLPGRFQVVENNRSFRAIVDFAHTEQGLRSVIGLVRQYLRKKGERIIVVFGCNGERDQTKRAPMGKAACELADLVVVTTEDPRKEPVEQIYKQIEEGCLAAGGLLNKTFYRIDDRREAIKFAINELAGKGDWVLFLGKGHEKSMNIDGVETPWDEIEMVRKAL